LESKDLQKIISLDDATTSVSLTTIP